MAVVVLMKVIGSNSMSRIARADAAAATCRFVAISEIYYEK
jgi:hypothetical protein